MDRIIRRAQMRLHAALPQCGLGVPDPGEPEELLRAQRRTVYRIVAEAFAARPELQKIAFLPEVTYADRDRTVELKVSVDLELTAMGHTAVVRGIKASDLVTDAGGDDRAAYAILQAKRTAYSELIKVLHLPYLEDQKELWEAEGFGIDIVRADVEASMLLGVLDVDALITRALKYDQRVLERQANLSKAPAVWNEATIASIPERITAGMPVHACDGDGVSALVAATAMRQANVVECLLEAGADPDRVDSAGFNAVVTAIIVRDIDGFKRLVRAGGDPAGPSSLPSLLVAIRSGNPMKALGAVMDAGVSATDLMPNGEPFVDWLDGPVRGMSEEGSRQIAAMVRARMTADQISDVLEAGEGGVPSRASIPKFGSSL